MSSRLDKTPFHFGLDPGKVPADACSLRRATAMSTLRKLHQLEPLDRKGGTGNADAAARITGDCLAIAVYGSAHPGVNPGFSFKVVSGIDGYLISEDGLAVAKRVDDVFGKEYYAMTSRQSLLSTASGAFSVPEWVAHIANIRSNPFVTVCNYLSMFGFLGLIVYLVKSYILYAKYEINFRLALPGKERPIEEQAAFVYDQLCLTDEDLTKAAFSAVYRSDGGILPEAERAILLPHERKRIRQYIEKGSYRRYGRTLESEWEREAFTLLLESEAAKIKHVKEAQFIRAVGQNSALAARKLMQRCPNVDLAHPEELEALMKTVRKENMQNIVFNVLIAVLVIIGSLIVAPILIAKFGFIDPMVWLVLGVVMLVVDLYYCGYMIAMHHPTPREKLVMMGISCVAAAVGIASLAFASSILGWLALGCQLLFALYVLYQYYKTQKSSVGKTHPLFLPEAGFFAQGKGLHEERDRRLRLVHCIGEGTCCPHCIRV